MRPITTLYLSMLGRLEASPEFRAELNHVRAVLDFPLEKITPEYFLEQYVYVVLCSYWKEQYARREWDRFFDTRNPDVISNLRKRAAIMQGVTHAAEWLRNLQAAHDKLAYLNSLPMIGPVTCRHLARNIGIDCVKPDRHLCRVAATFGYGHSSKARESAEICTRMCQDIRDEIGGSEKIGLIDVVLWRACNMGWL